MSQRNSEYARKERDLYETPEWVTEELLRHIPTFRSAWEPACGSGQMARVLRRGRTGAVVETDLATGDDFLLSTDAHGCDAIITNPPYGLAQEFIEHALQLMEPVNGLVCMLLRTDFDHAKSRRHLFWDCPAFAKKVVLMRRIVWFADENGKPKASPSYNHCWQIWDWKHEGAPTIAYGP